MGRRIRDAGRSVRYRNEDYGGCGNGFSQPLFVFKLLSMMEAIVHTYFPVLLQFLHEMEAKP